MGNLPPRWQIRPSAQLGQRHHKVLVRRLLTKPKLWPQTCPLPLSNVNRKKDDYRPIGRAKTTKDVHDADLANSKSNGSNKLLQTWPF